MTLFLGIFDCRPARSRTVTLRFAARRLLWLAALCALSGCSVWQTTGDEPTSLPIPKMSPDAVSLEIAFLHVPEGDPLLQEPLWQAVDELHIPVDVRRQLSANGLRCGVVGTQLPIEWQQIIESAELTAGDSLAGEIQNVRRRVQARSGRRSEIWTSKRLDELALLMTDDEGNVVGRTFHDASCMFAMKAHPQGNGQVNLELVPELHFGQPRSEYVGQDGMFRLKVERDKEVFNSLRVEASLSAGQSLVISCANEPTGLGKHFFTASDGQGSYRQFLLIRLAHTQFDDLFAPVEQLTPLATPAE